MGALPILTSDVLGPEHWAVRTLQWGGQEGRGFNTQRAETRARQQAELSEFQLTRDQGVPWLPGLLRRGTQQGLRRGVLSALRRAAGDKLLHTREAGNERRWLSHDHMFGLVFLTEQKLLCQLHGKLLCNYRAGSGQARSSCTITEGERREWPRTRLQQARLSTWSPTCPLPAGPSRCTHQAESSTPQAQAQADEEGGGEYSVCSQKMKQNWGSGVLGSSTSSRSQFPHSTARGQTR